MERDLVFTENRTASTNWMMATLSDVADVTISNVDKKTKPGEIPIRLCNYTDVYYNQHIRSNIDFMSATATDREIARCSLFKGDVVITKDSEKDDDIGIPAYISENIDGLVCGYHLVILRPKPEKINGAYLFYSLNSRETEHQFHARANGVTRFGLRKADIGTVTVPLPPLAEQRRIAHILGTLDDKIELNRRMNETLEEMARAIFKDWFVDFGPVRAKMEGREAYLPEEIWRLFPDRLVESELGEVPEGWGVRALGDVMELRYGKSLTAKNRRVGDVPVYGSNGQVGWHNEELVKGPGIVVGRKGNPGVVKWVHSDFFPIDTTFYAASKLEPPSMHFLFFALEEQDLPSVAADSAVPGLNRNLAYMNEQALPTGALLGKFTQIVSAMFANRRELEAETMELTDLRDEMLPKLVAGDIDLTACEPGVTIHGN